MEHGEAVLKKGSSTCRDPFTLVRGQSKSWKLGVSRTQGLVVVGGLPGHC